MNFRKFLTFFVVYFSKIMDTNQHMSLLIVRPHLMITPQHLLIVHRNITVLRLHIVHQCISQHLITAQHLATILHLIIHPAITLQVIVHLHTAHLAIVHLLIALQVILHLPIIQSQLTTKLHNIIRNMIIMMLLL